MINKKLLTLTLASIILVPLSSFAQATTTSATTTSATSTVANCMGNALDKRENALIGAHDVYNTAVKTALTNRLTALKASWNELEKKARIAKREAAYKAFRTEIQTANSTVRLAKNNAWKTFQTDAKSCGIKGTGESPSYISGGNISL